MGKADRFKESEIEYIRAVYSEVGPTEVARVLGRSKSAVKARAKAMGISFGKAGNNFLQARSSDEDEPGKAERQDTLARLYELRAVLRQNMAQAPPNAIAALSREYRACLEDIEKLEAANDERGSDALAAIGAAVKAGMQAEA